MAPYILALSNGLNNISEDEFIYLKQFQGQGAEKQWLLAYQGMVNKAFPDYNPEELQKWREMCNKDIQKEGAGLKEQILNTLKTLVFLKLKEQFGDGYESQIGKLKNECEGRIYAHMEKENESDFDKYDWKDFITLSDIQDLLDKNFVYDKFYKAFGINLNKEGGTSKKDKLGWLSLLATDKKKNKAPLTQSDIDRLWMVANHLDNVLAASDAE